MILILQEETAVFESNEQVVTVYEVVDFGVPSGITQNILTAKGQLIGSTAANAPAAVPAPDAVGKVLTGDPNQTIGMKWEYPSISVDDNSNYLINGGHIYAQRIGIAGYVTVADNKYGVDRWRITRENADVQVYRGAQEYPGTLSPTQMQIKKITNAGKFATCQIVEQANCAPLTGSNLIFQLKMKASAAKTIYIAILSNIGSANTIAASMVTAWNANTVSPTFDANLSVVASIACNVTTTWNQFSVTCVCPTVAGGANRNLIVAIWTDSQFAINDVLQIADCGLYTGTQTRVFQMRLNQQEIALVQRYCSKSFDIHTQPAQNAGTGGSIAGPATKAGAALNYISHRFPVMMLGTPTVTFYNPSAANALLRDITASLDGGAVSTTILTRDGMTVQGNGNAGSVVGNLVGVHYLAESEL